MNRRQKLGLGTPLTDDRLVSLLLERSNGLSGAELHDVSELAAGMTTGSVQGLARATRDKLVAIAKRIGLLREGSGARTVKELRVEQTAERVPTLGEKKAIDVLAGARRALACKPPIRRPV